MPTFTGPLARWNGRELPPVAGGSPDETIEETSDALEVVEEKAEEAAQEIESGEKEAAKESLDELRAALNAARAEIEELRALVGSARSDLDAHTGQHPDSLDSHPALAEWERDLGEWDKSEHAPEDTHPRYRKVFGG